MAAPQIGGRRGLMWTVWALMAAAVLLGRLETALADNTWLTGEALRAALSQKVTVVWENIQVRKALEGLSQAQKVALILDRRVDPDQKIELSIDDVPLQEALQQIAARLRIGTTILGPVAYFGPQSTCDRLPTISALRLQDANRLSPAVRARWTQPHPWKWDDLAAPRELLSDLAKETGFEIKGLEQVPADLWAHADLPPLTLPERLTLVLGQFDLTYEPSADGSSIRLAPMPDKTVLEQQHPLAASPQHAASAPHPEKMAQRTAGGEGQKVYTLQVELPVGKLLQSLGPRMGLEIHLDQPAISVAGISMEQKVKLDVKEVSGEALLKAVLDPAGLTFTRKDNVVDVHPKK